MPDLLSRNVACMATRLILANKGSHKHKFQRTFAFDFDPVQVFSAENVRKEQMLEERWRDLLLYMQGGQVPSPPPSSYLDEFAVIDNCLFYNSSRDADNYRLVVPQSLVSHALFMAHDGKLCMHRGFIKTLHFAKEHFYWPRMIGDIKKYCKMCLPCQRRKPGRRPVAPLGQLPMVDGVLQRVGVDLIGPMDETVGGNLYILTVVDHFSRYTELFPLKSKTAFEVSRNFTKFLIRHGHVQTILSDRGCKFLSAMFEDVCNQFGILKKATSAYNPKCNGLTESKNKQIGDILHFLAETIDDDWDEVLHFVEAGLNGSFQPVVNNTPYYLFHGRDYKLPYNLIFNKCHTFCDTDDAAGKLQKAFIKARDVQQEVSHQTLLRYNQTIRPHIFEVGDLVLVVNTTKQGPHTRKLNARYNGPYRVLEVVSEQVIKIADLQRPNKFYIVNVNRCKLFHSNQIEFPFVASTPSDFVEDDNLALPISDTLQPALPSLQRSHPMRLRSHSALTDSTLSQPKKHVSFADESTTLVAWPSTVGTFFYDSSATADNHHRIRPIGIVLEY